MRRSPHFVFIPFVLSLLLAFGCAKDPADAAPAAKVSAATPVQGDEVAPATATAEAPDEAAEKVAELSGSEPAEAASEKVHERRLPLTGTISFMGSKITGSHRGVFKQWKGHLILQKTAADKRLSLTFKVVMNSVFSDPDDRTPWSEKLDSHLKSKDFFAVEKYPSGDFVSTDIVETKSREEHTHMITGNLTLRGVTKTVNFPATIAMTDRQFTGKAQFSINRKDFGIVYPGKPDDLIRDRVVLEMNLTTATK